MAKNKQVKKVINGVEVTLTEIGDTPVGYRYNDVSIYREKTGAGFTYYWCPRPIMRAALGGYIINP